MSPAVDWPNGMEGGRLHGHEEVRAFWKRQWAIMDRHVDPLRLAEDESGNTVVEVHLLVRGLSGEIIADEMVLHVFTIRDGLIAHMRIRHPHPRAGTV